MKWNKQLRTDRINSNWENREGNQFLKPITYIPYFKNAGFATLRCKMLLICFSKESGASARIRRGDSATSTSPWVQSRGGDAGWTVLLQNKENLPWSRSSQFPRAFPQFQCCRINKLCVEYKVVLTIKALWGTHRYWWCRSSWAPGCRGQSRTLEWELAAWKHTGTGKLENGKCSGSTCNDMAEVRRLLWPGLSVTSEVLSWKPVIHTALTGLNTCHLAA